MARLAQLLKKPSPKSCLRSGLNKQQSFTDRAKMIASQKAMMRSFSAAAKCKMRIKGSESLKRAVKAKSREKSSLKAVKSLNDQDLLVLGRLDNQSGLSH